MARITVLCPTYLGYERLICSAFQSRGHIVTWLENTSCVRDSVDRAALKYLKIMKLAKRAYRRISGVTQWSLLYFLDPVAIFHSWKAALTLLNKIPLDSTVALVIRGDMQPAWFYHALRRRVPGIELVNFQYDDLSRLCRPPMFWRRLFDRVYTYSYVDAVDEGFVYAPMPYFGEVCEPVEKRDIDILFIGSTHSKRDVLIDALSKKYPEVNIYYYLLGSSSVDGLTTQATPLPYEEYLNLLRRSRCVLDIPAIGQTGLTTRAYESLATKTKVITTNTHARRYPLFEYGNISILEEETLDLDMSFVFSAYNELPESVVGEYSLEHWISTLIGTHV